MGATGDALLAIFDADQVPRPEFLLKTVPPFGDPTIAVDISTLLSERREALTHAQDDLTTPVLAQGD